MPELAGDIIRKTGCAHFGYGKSAAGDHQPAGLEHAARRADAETVTGPGDILDRRAQAQFSAGVVELTEQHVDDRAGTAITKELAQRLFMPGDIVPREPGDEILRGEARQSRLGEMRIGGNEISGGGVDIGEVTSSAARYPDLLGGAGGMINDQNPQTCFAGACAIEQARRTGPDDQGIKKVF